MTRARSPTAEHGCSATADPNPRASPIHNSPPHPSYPPPPGRARFRPAAHGRAASPSARDPSRPDRHPPTSLPRCPIRTAADLQIRQSLTTGSVAPTAQTRDRHTPPDRRPPRSALASQVARAAAWTPGSLAAHTPARAPTATPDSARPIRAASRPVPAQRPGTHPDSAPTPRSGHPRPAATPRTSIRRLRPDRLRPPRADPRARLRQPSIRRAHLPLSEHPFDLVAEDPPPHPPPTATPHSHLASSAEDPMTGPADRSPTPATHPPSPHTPHGHETAGGPSAPDHLAGRHSSVQEGVRNSV
jgi:hypothetical protein